MIGLYIVLGLIACACAIGAMMHNAPTGWEDEAGFHRGPVEDPRINERSK